MFDTFENACLIDLKTCFSFVFKLCAGASMEEARVLQCHGICCVEVEPVVPKMDELPLDRHAAVDESGQGVQKTLFPQQSRRRFQRP